MGERDGVKVIPTKLEEVTAEWLGSLISRKISRENFVVVGNVHAGTGFLSQMFRVSCEEETSEMSQGDGKKKVLNLIVKLLPEPGSSEIADMARAICISQGFDKTEIMFYEQILPELTEQLEEFKNYICPFYFGHVHEDPRTSVIIMEDMKPLGYKTITFESYITQSQLDEAVKFMAKFHFASSAIQFKKKIPLTEVYPFLQVEKDDDAFDQSMFASLCIEGLGKLDGFFEGQNCSNEFRDYYATPFPDLKKTVKAVFAARRNQYATLIHGDLWSNNILFHDNPHEVIAIDWQLTSYADPAYDLAVLIISSSRDLNRQNIDCLLKLYFDTFSEYAKKNGLEAVIKRDLEQFSAFFYTFAMAYVYLWFSYSAYPFSANFPRLLNTYEFLRKDIGVIEFMSSL